MATPRCHFWSPPGPKNGTTFGAIFRAQNWYRIPGLSNNPSIAGWQRSQFWVRNMAPKVVPFFGTGNEKIGHRQCHFQTMQASRGRVVCRPHTPPRTDREVRWAEPICNRKARRGGCIGPAELLEEEIGLPCWHACLAAIPLCLYMPKLICQS